VTIDGKLMGRGCGCSKKRASVAAAREALIAIEKNENRATSGKNESNENAATRLSGSSRSDASLRSDL
jgi:hypothetical protein